MASNTVKSRHKDFHCHFVLRRRKNLSFSGRRVLRQSLFILTYIERVIKSEVNAPAPLSKCHGIISILCCSSAELLWCPPSPLKLHRGPAHFPGPFPFGNWLLHFYLVSLSLSLVECSHIEVRWGEIGAGSALKHWRCLCHPHLGIFTSTISEPHCSKIRIYFNNTTTPLADKIMGGITSNHWFVLAAPYHLIHIIKLKTLHLRGSIPLHMLPVNTMCIQDYSAHWKYAFFCSWRQKILIYRWWYDHNGVCIRPLWLLETLLLHIATNSTTENLRVWI